VSVRLHIAQNCGPTGRILEKLLSEAGVELTHGPADAHVCWGAGGAYGEHVLNARCSGRNKLEELETLINAGIQTVPTYFALNLDAMQYPVLARNLHHHGGFDIRFCKNRIRAVRALRAGRAYFTRYIPSTTEYRVWIYRRRHLGTYEKVLAHPELKRRMIGRNHKNGYAFQLVHEANIPRTAVEMAIRSVGALGLDFGAVDVLLGRDGKFYVLEVNSAPGVQGPARLAIQSLAKRIAKWVEHGYPKRDADGDSSHSESHT
jgi:glutathione synthase/RimK-type ligase-like ATP-grasp enzyme